VSRRRINDGHEAWVRGWGRAGRLDDRPAPGSAACCPCSRHPETRDAAPRGATPAEPTDSLEARGAFGTDRDALPQGPAAETGTGGRRGRGVRRGVDRGVGDSGGGRGMTQPVTSPTVLKARKAPRMTSKQEIQTIKNLPRVQRLIVIMKIAGVFLVAIGLDGIVTRHYVSKLFYVPLGLVLSLRPLPRR